MKRFLVLLLVLVAATACGTPYQYSGTLLDPPKPGSDWTLTNQSGAAVQLSQQLGDITLVYFGYTSCPDFCPTTMGEWKQVRQQLGADAARVRFVLVSVDPETDTPTVLARYLQNFDPSFIGLRPTLEQLAALDTEYGLGLHGMTGAAAAAHQNHGTYTYVLNKAGELRMVIRSDIDAAAITSDVQHLLRSS
jgi:protein SCO1/2